MSVNGHIAASKLHSRLIGLLLLAVIATFLIFSGPSRAGEAAPPCHAELTALQSGDAAHIGDHEGQPHKHSQSESHESGSCCTMACGHSAIETVIAWAYEPPVTACRTAHSCGWTLQDARFRLDRPPRDLA